MADLKPSDMWAMYIEGLTKAAQVGDANSWMLTGTSLPAQLNTAGTGAPSFTAEQALAQIYRLGSLLPAWGSVESGGEQLPDHTIPDLVMADFASAVADNVGLFYTPTTVRQFEQYASFVRSIKLEGDPDPVCLAQLRQKQAELKKASDDWLETFHEAQEAFNQQDQFKTWEEFLKGTPFGQLLDAASDRVTGAQIAYDQQLKQCYGSDAANLSRALGKIRDTENALAGTGSSSFVMTIEDDSGEFPVPRYSPSSLGNPGYSQWLETAIANTGKLPPEVVININQTAQRYNYDEMKFAFNGSVRYSPYLWVEVSGSYENIDIDTASQQFSITIKMQSVTQVTFDPGQWYEGSWLTNYSQPGDHFDDSPFQKETIWGPNGIFNTQARSAIIAFRPEVTATFDSQSYRKMREAWEAEGNVKIGVGPFYLGIGGGASGTKEEVNWDEDQLSFSFTDKTLIPKILALQVAAPNWPPVD